MVGPSECSDPLLGVLLDVRSVFDPGSALTSTLQRAVGEVGRRSAVAWVALPETDGTLVIEHVLGERTHYLDRLDVGSGQGLTGSVFQRADVHWVDDYVGSSSISHEFDAIIEAERIRRMIAAPLRVDDDLLGVLSIGRRDSGDFGDEAIGHVERLAQRAGVALSIARAARDHAAAAALAERRRISEELHDGVGALLFSLSSRTERLQRSVDRDAFPGEIDRLADELNEVSGLVRDLVSRWHASATSDFQAEVQGIVEDFERRSEIHATALFLGNVPRLDSARMQALTRFVGVALSNVERHTQARRATVTVSSLPGQLAVAVFNDGPSPTAVVPGVGLGGAEERIARLGGTLTHVGGAGSTDDSDTDEDDTGFTIRARIPW